MMLGEEKSDYDQSIVNVSRLNLILSYAVSIEIQSLNIATRTPPIDCAQQRMVVSLVGIMIDIDQQGERH